MSHLQYIFVHGLSGCSLILSWNEDIRLVLLGILLAGAALQNIHSYFALFLMDRFQTF